jgi:hypothetical protein
VAVVGWVLLGAVMAPRGRPSLVQEFKNWFGASGRRARPRRPRDTTGSPTDGFTGKGLVSFPGVERVERVHGLTSFTAEQEGQRLVSFRRQSGGADLRPL